MPYGFNEDKSKCDLDQMIGEKFVVLEGSTASQVSSGGYSGVNITKQQLADAGITDIGKCVVVGAMYSWDDGAAWFTDIPQGANTNTAYPPLMVVTFGYTSAVPVRITFKNNYGSALTFKYRIVLMKLS